MPSLAEIQSLMRDAVVSGNTAALAPLFRGGPRPEKRLAIHRRNYAEGLAAALLKKFPATVWLVGPDFVRAGAIRFAERQPPQAPSIAEYGWNFPAFLARLPGALRVLYLNEFSQLEWCVGQVSIATASPAVGPEALTGLDPGGVEATLEMQPGLYYFQAAWPVDDLLGVYLSPDPPDWFEFDPLEVRLEIRGARGEFHIRRLGRAEFVFRRSLAEGGSIGRSAELALESDIGFDAAGALDSVIREGLVLGIVPGAESVGANEESKK